MVTDTWAALGEPHRRSLLDLLVRAPFTVGELVDAVGLSQPATSKHLRVLRDAGLVRVDKHAQQRIYTLDARPIAQIDHWLIPYRRLWSERLDALGRHLDNKEQ